MVIGGHCLAKHLLNRFPLSNKSITSLLSTGNGGVSGILLSFTNAFKMAQYVFRAVLGHLVHGISIWKIL